MQKYVFKKYNSEYPVFFTLEKKKIIKILGSTVNIEHVGSTAIPFLGGKGIIDIVIGVSKLRLTETKNKLEGAGYEFRDKASCPKRLFFRINYPYKNEKRRAHIHLTEFNSQNWKELIIFRDYLLNNPDAVKEYVKIKKEAVKKDLGDGEKYRKHKERFIASILKKVLK